MTNWDIALVATSIPLWALFLAQLIPARAMGRFEETSLGRVVVSTFTFIEKRVSKLLRIKN
jgi:hypothetical protein